MEGSITTQKQHDFTLPAAVATPFDWNCPGRVDAEEPLGCTFTSGHDGRLSVRYFVHPTDVYYRPHSCSEYTVLVCLQGAIVKKQPDRITRVGPGEALIINSGEEHAIGYLSPGAQPCQVVEISLDRSLLAALTRDFDLPPTGGGTGLAFSGKLPGDTLQPCVRDLVQELQGRRQGQSILVETLAIRLVVETVRHWPRAEIQKIEMATRPRLSRREFVRAYEFMRRCRKEDFRLQRLCRFLGTSEERFARLFLASTGDTPASFYNQLLLDQALDLLRQCKLSIKEIGFELGFKTCSHFNVAFRREFAVSPQEYRHRHHGAADCYTSVKTIAGNSRRFSPDDGKRTLPILEPVRLQRSQSRR